MSRKTSPTINMQSAMGNAVASKKPSQRLIRLHKQIYFFTVRHILFLPKFLDAFTFTRLILAAALISSIATDCLIYNNSCLAKAFRKKHIFIFKMFYRWTFTNFKDQFVVFIIKLIVTLFGCKYCFPVSFERF